MIEPIVPQNAGTSRGRPPHGALVLTEEYRRSFELEGEGALILRLEVPPGDPWRPDGIERQAATAWLLEKNRERQTEIRSRSDKRPRQGIDKWIRVCAGAGLSGFLLGAVFGYLLAWF